MAVSQSAKAPAVTRRSAKQERRAQLMKAAARLLAERGYDGVRLEDLGAAVGISGPAIYRHFDSKDSLLAELLVEISRRLLAGGKEVRRTLTEPGLVMTALLDFHLDFTMNEPDLIRIQDRDLHNLTASPRRTVRRLQREYVEIWVAAAQRLYPELAVDDARVAVHATFGLLNSTPYSAGTTPPDRTKDMLRRMAISALSHAA